MRRKGSWWSGNAWRSGRCRTRSGTSTNGCSERSAFDARPGDLIRGRGEFRKARRAGLGTLARILPWGWFSTIFAPSNHRAVGGLVHAGDDIEGGGLSGAVGSDEATISLVDGEVPDRRPPRRRTAWVIDPVSASRSLAVPPPSSALFLRNRSGSSLSPMILRKNSTTTMMMTENTTIRKPLRRKGRGAAGQAYGEAEGRRRSRRPENQQQPTTTITMKAMRRGSAGEVKRIGVQNRSQCRDAAAGDGADTADDHDQQNLVGHGRGEGSACA